MSRMSQIFWQSFFDTFSGAALFGPLRMPGEPDEFIDSRPLEEFLRSDDFLQVQAAVQPRKQQQPADVPKAAKEVYGPKSGLDSLFDSGSLYDPKSELLASVLLVDVRDDRGGLAGLLDAQAEFARILDEAVQRKYEVQKKHT